MEYDKDKVDEMVLALLNLTVFDNQSELRAWKGLDSDTLDWLHQKGYISDPKSKAKSLVRFLRQCIFSGRPQRTLFALWSLPRSR
jgi:hypothetical protein